MRFFNHNLVSVRSRAVWIALLALWAATACQSKPAAVTALPPEVIAKKIEEFYGLATGEKQRVLRVENRSNVYAVTLQSEAPGAKPREVFSTLDGRIGFEQSFDTTKRRESLLADKRFAQCLLDKGVRVFVEPGTAKTAEQLTHLGEFAQMLTIDCTASGGSACKAQHVEQVPSIGLGGRLEPGVHDRAWVEAFSGCK